MHPQRTALQRVTKPAFNSIPMWQGEPLQGKSILLMPEQGLGDQIQFVRYAQWLKSLGAKVLVGAGDALSNLLKTCPWIDEVVSDGASFAANYWIFSMSLPAIAKTTIKTIPNSVPYLYADASKVKQWGQWLLDAGMDKAKPVVGICWQGTSTHVQDKYRSIPLELFQPLMDLKDYQFIGLVRDQNAQLTYDIGGKVLHNAGPKLEDLADTAGLLENIDLLISIDSAPAHLAGSMNKPCWILLDSFVDFRWMLNYDKSPWYPSVKLIRKGLGEGWGGAIDRVKKMLADTKDFANH